MLLPAFSTERTGARSLQNQAGMYAVCKQSFAFHYCICLSMPLSDSDAVSWLVIERTNVLKSCFVCP